MKQLLLDIKAFISHPTKKTIKKHKRMVGLTPQEKAKNATERSKKRDTEKNRKLEEYDHQVEKWEEYLECSMVVDQQSKNAAACFECFGEAPTRSEPMTLADIKSSDAERSFSGYTSLLSQDSIYSIEQDSGCKLSP
jgi:hypothetical protein